MGRGSSQDHGVLPPLGAAGGGLQAGIRQGVQVRGAGLPLKQPPGLRAQVRRLGPAGQRLFELEVRATDLYTLAYPRLDAASGGAEWREGPVILGGPAPC